MAKGDIKRRREVERLSASLPSMNAEQRKDAIDCCGTAWIGAKKGWCDVCAQEFDSESLWKGRKKHNDCLIIGARVNGRRTETIEIDTKEWKIVQCRGKHNQSSRYHTRIVKLMNQNMNKFKEAMAL